MKPTTIRVPQTTRALTTGALPKPRAVLRRIRPAWLTMAAMATILSWSTPAAAVIDICLEDRAGTGLTCTANDFSVTLMQIDTVTSPDIVCTSQFDTLTLNGWLVAQSNSPQRYDIGI